MIRHPSMSVRGGRGAVLFLGGSSRCSRMLHNNLQNQSEGVFCVPVQKEWLFTYTDSSSNTALSLGTDGSGMTLTVDGVNCVISSLLSPAAFTSQMKLFCIVWDSTNGRVAVYANGVQWFNICSTSKGHSVPGGGQFRLGGKLSFGRFR